MGWERRADSFVSVNYSPPIQTNETLASFSKGECHGRKKCFLTTPYETLETNVADQQKTDISQSVGLSQQVTMKDCFEMPS